jgi:hypothetical protein
MPNRRFDLLLIPFPAALCLGVALAFTPIKKAPANDMDAFVKALPPPGANDRVFLALDPALEARLAIAPSVVRAIDPGIACDPSAATPGRPAATLGRAGSVRVICMLNGRSEGVMTLRDGTTYLTICGNALQASASLTIGNQTLNFFTESPKTSGELTHSCSGWTKVPS